MKLQELLHSLPCNSRGDLDREVTGLSYDSRQTESGHLFIALPGLKVDGHSYIPQALERGAVAVLHQNRVTLPDSVVGLQVGDSRRVMSRLAARFYADPSQSMSVVGVTGTNGKTTVSYLVEALLQANGCKPALFGTVAYRFGTRQESASHTTPEAPELQRLLADFRDAGADALVMEVSSHALDQQRVADIAFDIVAFTNLTPEHLDYHADLEDYFCVKQRLFSAGSRELKRVANIDDTFGRRLAGEFPGTLTYGLTEGAEITARSVEFDLAGIRAELITPKGTAAFSSPLVGRFNLENLLCAAAIGHHLGLSTASIAETLAVAPQAPGRLQQVANRLGAHILVDYAHTGDALDKALKALRELQPERLLVLFGCGGDRDRSKRPVMGMAATRSANLLIVTSDNPRSEDPESIIEDIRPGLEGLEELSRDQFGQGTGGGYLIEVDRRRAIECAVACLRRNDLLLVAGKGHEDYQIIGQTRQHFDDVEELQLALQRRQGDVCS